MFLVGHSQLSPSQLYSTQLHCGFSSGTSRTANRVPLCCVEAQSFVVLVRIMFRLFAQVTTAVSCAFLIAKVILSKVRIGCSSRHPASQHSVLRHDGVWLHLLLSV